MTYNNHIIKFKLRGKPIVFNVWHNLIELGLDIEAAFVNWSVRTKEFTEQSFCEYVMSKDISIVCLNEKDYNLQKSKKE